MTERQKMPRAYYQRIGSIGGLETLDRYGREHYAEIGRKGAVRVKDLIEAGKAALAVQAAEAKLRVELDDLREEED